MRVSCFALALVSVADGSRERMAAQSLKAEPAVLIPYSPKSESVVPFGTDGFLAGSMQSQGTVKKYAADGTESKDWIPIAGLVNPRGLAISNSSERLWVADDTGVSQYSLGESGATLDARYSLNHFTVDEANGLCLNSDESKIFVTQPGWKLLPYGPSGLNALVEIDLERQESKLLFQNVTGQSPNGCVVDGDTVWMVGQKDGITSYDLSSGTVSGTTPWSQQVKEYQTSTQSVGDGLVLFGGAFYTSTWKIKRGKATGVIHRVGPDLAMEDFADVVAADMQLDMREDPPTLIAPDLNAGQTLALIL